MQRVTKEAPPTETYQPDAQAGALKAEEGPQEPLVELLQAQQPIESANEELQPCDPAPTAELANGVQIDAADPEPQSTISITQCPTAQAN